MATIVISNLNPTGSDLFYDSENFLQDLSEDEQEIYGGVVWTYWVAQGAAAAVRSSRGCAAVAVAVIEEIVD